MRSILALLLFAGATAPTVALAQTEDADDEETNTAAMEQAGEGMDDERARSHFRAGNNLYEAGAFERAGEEFAEAYELSGRPELLYNVYVAYRDAGDVREAEDALRRYLDEAEQVQDRVNLEARLRSLEEQVAALDLAEEAAADEQRQQEERDQMVTPPPTQAPPQDEGPGVVPWVLVGVGGAALVAGAITGSMALGAVSEIEDSCPEDDCPADYDLEGERDSARTLVTVTDVLLLSGAVIGLGGVAWLLFGGGGGAEEAPPADVGAACTGDGCMATVRGRF